MKLITIDAYSQIFRMFYGIRGGMLSPDGLNTNSVYGIARLLFTLDRDFPANYAVAAFDKGKCSIRTEIQSDYKGTRKAMPEELREQIPAIRKWFDLMGWNILEKEGVEADDIVAAAVTKYDSIDSRLILSSDKDLLQLVNEQVNQMIPAPKGTFKIMDRLAVTDKMGVPPEMVLDYLSLIGDAADNIPGVQGVGPKTAAKLLLEHKSIDNLLANLSTVKRPALRDKLASSTDLLAKNHKMIQLYPNSIEMPELSQIKRRPIQAEKLFEFAVELGFKSILREIEGLIEKEHNPTLFDF